MKIINFITPRNVFLLIIILVIFGLGFRHYQDLKQSQKIYQQLITYDMVLDDLKTEAAKLKTYDLLVKDLLIQIKKIKKNNLNKDELVKSVNLINFNPKLKAQMIESIQMLGNHNYLEVHQSLNKAYEVLHFTLTRTSEQIANNTLMIQQGLNFINIQIAQIGSRKIKSLDLARLNFVIHKLDEDTKIIHQSIVGITLNDLENAEFYKTNNTDKR